jgi:hypothetical protein
MRNFILGFVRRLVPVGLVAVAAVAASAATKGPDAGGYTATDGTVYSLVDIAGEGGAASLLSGIDDGVAPLTLPFPFRFYGEPYTVVCASANGALYFVGAAAACGGFSDFANADLTTTAPPNDAPAIMPFWSDLTFQAPGAGAVYYKAVGSAGSRRFVVQWNDAYPQGSPNPVTFQIVLYEGSNRILFQYRTIGLGEANAATNGGRATVGIRNAGSVASKQLLEWSFSAPVLSDQSALLFTPAAAVSAGDVNADGVVDCADVNVVKASFGKRTGQPGFDARADVVRDGLVNVLDLATVTRAAPVGLRCP